MVGEISRPGPYRRAIRITAEANVARAAMEDDIHHFAVALHHDGATIRRAVAQSIRTPWSTCAAASIALARLAGMPLVSPLPFAGDAERFANCTHMLDLANLAAGRALQPGFSRLYRIEVESESLRAVRASLAIDGGPPLLEWRVVNGRLADGDYAGLSPDTLLALMADQPIDEREPVIALRRAVHIGQSRNFDLDIFRVASELPPMMPTCHTLQPDILPAAVRHRGTYTDFSAAGRWPLEDGGKARRGASSLDGTAGDPL
jgi:hypothetical protein